MTGTDALRLMLLSTLWGMSFIFMRVAAPEFGPIPLIFVRMGLGAALLFPLLLGAGHLRLALDHLGGLFVLGLFNHVIPFTLLALATTQLEAGFTSLINATTPLFTALIGAALFATPVGLAQIVGLAIAFSGVYVLSADRLDFALGGDGWFILAALGATLSYGVATNFSKTRLSHLPTRVLAAGSIGMSGFILLIPGLLLWPDTPISLLGWANSVGLAVFSTTVAFLIYFGLLARAGATATSTVTFLVPVSTLLWAWLLLDETLTLRIMAGMVITLFGTALATGLLRRQFLRRLLHS